MHSYKPLTLPAELESENADARLKLHIKEMMKTVKENILSICENSPDFSKTHLETLLFRCSSVFLANKIYLNMPGSIDSLQNLLINALKSNDTDEKFTLKLDAWVREYKALEKKETDEMRRRSGSRENHKTADVRRNADTKVKVKKAKVSNATPDTNVKVSPDNVDTNAKVLPDNNNQKTKVLSDNENVLERRLSHQSAKPKAIKREFAKPKYRAEDLLGLQNDLHKKLSGREEPNKQAPKSIIKSQIEFDEALARYLDALYRDEIQSKRDGNDLFNEAFIETYKYFNSQNKLGFFKPADKNLKSSQDSKDSIKFDDDEPLYIPKKNKI